MYNPIVTYRIQFQQAFSLKDFQQVRDYLSRLGVRTVYAAPVLTSVPGSVHGYDAVDVSHVNPEIGTEEELKDTIRGLQEQGIGWLQDIVPNHMAFHPDNMRLMDVLEHGPDSRYAGLFDRLGQAGEPLMAPFLGAPLEEVIAKQELQLTEQDGRFCFGYYDARYPLNAASSDKVRARLGDAEQRNEALAQLSRDAGFMQELAEQQHYRLCHWQETDRAVNYRRFFTINGLISLNVQDEQVFRQTHEYLLSLVKQGLLKGLRIDHIDGLYDPTAYLERLRAAAGPDTYIVVEKILGADEALPRWPVAGATGYEFLATVNNLLTNTGSDRKLTSFYRRLTGDRRPVQQQLYEKKANLLHRHMNGELDHLCRLFSESGLATEDALQTATYDVLRAAIGEFLIQCPVYRYYAERWPLAGAEADAVRRMLARIDATKPALAAGTALLEQALLIRPEQEDAGYRGRALHFYRRCMQFTGPLMAKGAEDTLMYTYNRFIAHNEVGDSPETFGITVPEFHRAMIRRQQRQPYALNATATHDTKRGEDVRARLHVLTDIPEEWIAKVKEWEQLTQEARGTGGPDAAERYFIYQTLTGCYPFPGQEDADLPQRLSDYLIKALREAKIHSDWNRPDEAYEEQVKEFAAKLLDQDAIFLRSIEDFIADIADDGIVNSLVQVALKFTCPGVPDIYQGAELWDLSLVDPDNRRPVDYQQRLQLLDALPEEGAEGADQLWERRYNGQIKLWLIRQLAGVRSRHPELFTEGHYIPLRVRGKYQANVLAFARHYKQEWCVVAVPLHLAALSRSQDVHFRELDWKDTEILLPASMPEAWTHLLSDIRGTAAKKIAVQDIFGKLPLAVLELEHPAQERSAGLLLPVTALPGPFGMGDLGPAAYAFARFLGRSAQRCWQLLPLNPVREQDGYSPYSAASSMAGNTLLISPELLAEEGLLTEEELAAFHLPEEEAVDYASATRAREALLQRAYEHYCAIRPATLQADFASFKETNAWWLEDYVPYVLLKRRFDGLPWYEWPEPYKQRDHQAIDEVGKGAPAEEIRWQQFLFSRQWAALRKYCNTAGITLIGDLPFYVSYDSADVWARPDIFSLDEEGRMTGVAGVPPDYFSETGQLWNVPTFRWDRLKEEDYAWWITRLRKNLELYDLLRIDHFRALAAYWEVPAGARDAVGGKWLEGPGTDFFRAMREAFGELPFIAEDLGDDMEAVYALREAVGLPGMKVIQFAFGEGLPGSVDIPHNYPPDCIVYTGTHDNNTLLGWYRHETTAEDRARLERYAGCRVTERNLHDVVARLVYGSVGRIAILPVQDVLRLDEGARINMPSKGEGNWTWRLKPGQLNDAQSAWLADHASFYNRR